MPPCNRRRFLTLGTTTVATALAGCWGTTDSLTYADWIPATDGSILTAYLDLTISQKSSQIDPLLPLFLPSKDSSSATGVAPDFSALNQIDEPLLRLPLQTGGQLIGVSGLSLTASGLSYLVDPTQPTEGVTELFRVNDTVVGTGTIDVSKADESLRAGREDFLGEMKYDVVSEGGNYTIYQPTLDVTGAVAVSESAVLVSDSQRKVQTVIETWQGTHDRAVEENDTVKWLFDTIRSGDMVVGWLGPVHLQDFYWERMDAEPATEIVSQKDDVLSSVTFSPEGRRITAELALQDDGIASLTERQLQTKLGISGTETEMAIDGTRLSATTSYTDDDLDIEYFERTEPTPETTETPQKSPSEAAADAIPDNAFEFSHDEDKGTVRVTFAKKFDADKVTVKAVESDSEASTTTPDPVSYLNVYLAPDGDEVVVTVTVDGETFEVARKVFPSSH
ncbi:hypothetical protein ACFR9U_14505 [Halorientalis brevis]|uniref:Uncharacterized protein n=1 Tax=Halorientalis brevis TaxID=1126241 RepID=A0ABD6CF38_9EURY|nr:hypothetical protein [Halorientalis brevis]